MCNETTFKVYKASLPETKFYGLTKFHWVEAVEKVTNISYSQMIGKSRLKPIVDARHLAMWFIRRYCGITVKELGRFFNRDHTTVVSALMKTSNFYINERQTKYKIEQIKRIIHEN